MNPRKLTFGPPLTVSNSPRKRREKQAAALNNLAILLLLRGDNDGAEILLNQALALSSPASRLSGRCLNNLGVLAELRGDRPKAEELYAKAKNVFATSTNSSETEQRQVEKNLARLSNSR
ncbi:MAG: tetratricopeptide repeat protein [Terriglobia bacterium]